MHGRARVGFRLHTGWAILVAVDAEEGAPRVLHRCRLELLPPGMGRFVYHQAGELALPHAERLIGSVRLAAEETARTALGTAIRNLNVTGACLPAGTTSAPDDLTVVLRSHARIHAPEGALYAAAIASACENFDIPLITVRERDVWSLAAANAGGQRRS